MPRLEKGRAACAAPPRDEYEARALQALPGLLADGGKLAGLSGRQCEELAWGVWAAQQEMNEALARRARPELDGTPNDP